MIRCEAVGFRARRIQRDACELRPLTRLAVSTARLTAPVRFFVEDTLGLAEPAARSTVNATLGRDMGPAFYKGDQKEFALSILIPTSDESQLIFVSFVIDRSIEESDMHPFKLTTLPSAAVLVFVLSASDVYAGNDACKILPAEKFSEIMGYKARIDRSTESTCMYKGAGDAGGMLMIVTEKATPQTIAMADSQGSTPQGKDGKLGATFSKGTVVFTVGITGTDPAKVNALAAEVKRNLK